MRFFESVLSFRGVLGLFQQMVLKVLELVQGFFMVLRFACVAFSCRRRGAQDVLVHRHKGQNHVQGHRGQSRRRRKDCSQLRKNRHTRRRGSPRNESSQLELHGIFEVRRQSNGTVHDGYPNVSALIGVNLPKFNDLKTQYKDVVKQLKTYVPSERRLEHLLKTALKPTQILIVT